MGNSPEKSNLHIAVVSAVTAVTTALITAGATVYTSNKSASQSAERAASQAGVATAAASQSQARLESLVPAGAVVAFQGNCPTGWLSFDGANGRFIVGADTSYPSGAAGGKSEMLFEYIGEGQYSNTGTGSYRPSQNQVGVRNGDRVMNVSTLPPYIALRMCVKQ